MIKGIASQDFQVTAETVVLHVVRAGSRLQGPLVGGVAGVAAGSASGVEHCTPAHQRSLLQTSVGKKTFISKMGEILEKGMDIT
jgi:hypothetical protein